MSEHRQTFCFPDNYPPTPGDKHHHQRSRNNVMEPQGRYEEVRRRRRGRKQKGHRSPATAGQAEAQLNSEKATGTGGMTTTASVIPDPEKYVTVYRPHLYAFLLFVGVLLVVCAVLGTSLYYNQTPPTTAVSDAWEHVACKRQLEDYKVRVKELQKDKERLEALQDRCDRKLERARNEGILQKVWNSVVGQLFYLT